MRAEAQLYPANLCCHCRNEGGGWDTPDVARVLLRTLLHHHRVQLDQLADPSGDGSLATLAAGQQSSEVIHQLIRPHRHHPVHVALLLHWRAVVMDLVACAADGVASNKADVSTSAALSVIQTLYATTTVRPAHAHGHGLTVWTSLTPSQIHCML